MKRLLATVLALMMLLLSACTPQETPDNGETSGTSAESTSEATTAAPEPTQPSKPEDLILAKDGASSYTIILPAFGGGSGSSEASTKLIKLFQEETGITLTMKPDALAKESETEILIGTTDRTPEISLEEDQVCVLVSEKKVILAAGKDEYLPYAVDLFMKKLKYNKGIAKLDGDLDAKKTMKETFTTITVASYNTKHGEDVGCDYKKLADDILESGASIVGLQEVDQNTSRNGNQNMMQVLAQYLGWDYYCFQSTMALGGGEYGIGILSQYPILETEYRSLPISPDDPYGEARVVLHARIDVDGTEFNFFCTHCGFVNNVEQLQTINRWISTFDSYILVGDFNYSNFADFYASFPGATLSVNEKNGLKTFDTSAIDNIILSSAISLNSIRILDNGHSDHRMLYASVTQKKIS